MKRVFIILSILLISISHLLAQSHAEILGSWNGKLDLGAAKLSVVFHFSLIEGGLHATMDSPDQGATGIAVEKVTYKEGLLNLDVTVVQGTFDGKLLEGDSVIDGNWSQAGRSWPLLLAKGGFKKPNRPQEPQPPYPYLENEVKFDNKKAGITLAGTLTKPKLRQPVPAVVMITGSGGQNRDEEIFYHKPFKVIADHLTRNGIAVLRFDDRGVADSEGDQATATSLDFATDVSAAVEFLKSQKNIIPDQIGLIGHSEGGMIAPITANNRDDIAFLILLAGPGTTGKQILLDQTELIYSKSGAREGLIQDILEANAMIYQLIEKEEDNDKASKKIRKYVKKKAKGYSDAEKQSRGWSDEMLEQNLNILTSPWFRYFLSFDPVPVLQQVKCPVLALNGSLDLQVAAAQNLAGIEKALQEGGNTQFTIKEFQELNHLFQHSKTGLITEYVQIEETFSPEVLDFMTNWIISQIK
ncbi:MAG: alpha/beta hydrolase [Bacteroidetes bacterium]|nr:alpha/beta hydrolase [Bacteroidota bacterium]